jgi:hypothetical protein
MSLSSAASRILVTDENRKRIETFCKECLTAHWEELCKVPTVTENVVEQLKEFALEMQGHGLLELAEVLWLLSRAYMAIVHVKGFSTNIVESRSHMIARAWDRFRDIVVHQFGLVNVNVPFI